MISKSKKVGLIIGFFAAVFILIGYSFSQNYDWFSTKDEKSLGDASSSGLSSNTDNKITYNGVSNGKSDGYEVILGANIETSDSEYWQNSPDDLEQNSQRMELFITQRVEEKAGKQYTSYHGRLFSGLGSEKEPVSIVFNFDWHNDGYLIDVDWLGLLSEHPLKRYATGILWSMSKKLSKDTLLSFKMDDVSLTYEYYVVKEGSVVGRKLISIEPNFDNAEDQWVMNIDKSPGFFSVVSVKGKSSVTKRIDKQYMHVHALSSIKRLQADEDFVLQKINVDNPDNNDLANKWWLDNANASINEGLSLIKSEQDLLDIIKSFQNSSSHLKRDIIGQYIAENYNFDELNVLFEKLDDNDLAIVIHAIAYADSPYAESLLTQVASSDESSYENAYRAVVSLANLKSPTHETVTTLKSLAIESNNKHQDIVDNSLIQLGALYDRVDDSLKVEVDNVLNAYANSANTKEDILLYAQQATNNAIYLDNAVKKMEDKITSVAVRLAASNLLAHQYKAGNEQALPKIKQFLNQKNSPRVIKELVSGVDNISDYPELSDILKQKAIVTDNEGVRATIIEQLIINQAACRSNSDFLMDALKQKVVNDSVKSTIREKCPLIPQ